jgi:hypothetical protein
LLSRTYMKRTVKTLFLSAEAFSLFRQFGGLLGTANRARSFPVV